VGTATNVIDTHSHCLPLVDHGSPDLETTLRMIEAAAALGTTTICCTPHLYEYDADFVERARETHREVAAAVEAAGIPVRLLLGFEVDLTIAATAEPDVLRGLCIQNEGPESSSGVLVVEMPFSNWPPFFEETIFRLTTTGLMPIIAHPERNDRVQHSPEVLEPCINAGAVLQGTSGSLTGQFRKTSRKAFLELLARGWFGLLASDGHSKPDYTWTVGAMLAELGDRLAPQDRDLLVNVNPARVLEGKRPIPLAPKRPPRKGRRLFG
jgi:protein-tyrosine phosphatase